MITFNEWWKDTRLNWRSKEDAARIAWYAAMAQGEDERDTLRGQVNTWATRAEAHRQNSVALSTANTELLEALKDAVDLADGLVESMDYLGAGTDSKAAAKYQREDRAIVARLRAFVAKAEGT